MRVEPKIKDEDINVINIDDVMRSIKKEALEKGRKYDEDLEVSWGENGWNALQQFKPNSPEGFTYFNIKHYKK